ncbi:glutathione S-transferase theta-1-like [Neophocaena asiaeorientalis asiaeorientalis]|uniref:Glutathione S-transferase theta-1-like n=1 Tax=Neophocaena asiaeorientalis asiaeorientalis TaxID=1706337 RepID=A0A341CXL3_NEOAA|nr:glutathione S-transferase theta-1-like [Neophocaena asiaeorientalis asiaeorientalis]XP_032459541.1 glutathione S-transferase theta-1-like [Phocoena sinus]
MVLELFLDLYSPPCRAIYIFTRKNSIPFEMHPVELAQGEHLKPEFLKVNPLEKVPALRDGNFLVAESPVSPAPRLRAACGCCAAAAAVGEADARFAAPGSGGPGGQALPGH